MTAERRFEIPTHVVARDVQGELVVLDLEKGEYFGLEDVGAFIWGLLEAGESLGEVHARILAEYDVEADTARRDLAALVADLQARGLLRDRT
ncbi:MAG: PqqD family protein [Rhodobacteraceae bacterium]|nr:MAG: PqqD family protein [Paracoccaceae bacterium]